MLPFELRKKLHKALFDSKDEKTKHNLSEKNSRLTCTVLNLLFYWSPLISTSIVSRDRGVFTSQSLLFSQPIIWCSVNRYWDRSGSKYVVEKTGTHRDDSKYSGLRIKIWGRKSTRPNAPVRSVMWVNGLFQLLAVPVQTIADSFSSWRLSCEV